MKKNKYIKTSLSVAVCLSLASCSTLQQTPLGKIAKNTFYSDDPCSSNSRNWGITIGGVAGAAAGYYLEGSPTGIIVGTVVGAGIGGLVGYRMDKKRCELAKIAQKYDLQMELYNINPNGDADNNKETQDSSIGLSMSLGEKNGLGHFEVDSDQLTPKAKQYFADLAKAYNPKIIAQQILDAKQRSEYLKSTKEQKLFLIGHTDDSGDSEYNTALSERRAKVVASFMKSQGINESSLYFQGAGEYLPKADNRSVEGRAQNRRVEIVEVANEVGFQRYLEARKPKHEYYRPIESDSSLPVPSIKSAAATQVAATASTTAMSSATVEKANDRAIVNINNQTKASTPANISPSDIRSPKTYNFGGNPITLANSKINIGTALQNEAGFSFISTANASDSVVLNSCNRDRPRSAGSVKSLKSGKAYETTEYLKGLYNTSWHDTLNGNLIMMNHVAILRDSGAPANNPDIKIYSAYDPQKSKTAKPDIKLTPAVNTYRGSKGVLYRVFAQGAGGIQCMDILFPGSGGFEAKVGKIIYTQEGNTFVADYKPEMIR